MAVWSDDIYTTYHGPILGFLRKRLGNNEVAEDLAQTTFLKAYRTIGNLDENPNSKAWLYQIATNLLIDYRRSPKNQDTANVDDHTDMPGKSTVEGEALQHETVAEVRATLERLAPKYKNILIRINFQGMSCADIAALDKTTLATVKCLSSRARKHFMNAYRGAS